MLNIDFTFCLYDFHGVKLFRNLRLWYHYFSIENYTYAPTSKYMLSKIVINKENQFIKPLESRGHIYDSTINVHKIFSLYIYILNGLCSEKRVNSEIELYCNILCSRISHTNAPKLMKRRYRKEFK